MSQRPAYDRGMPTTLDGRLVVAISSRALFDFEEENRVFEGNDDRAYMQVQLERLDVPARPGVGHAARLSSCAQSQDPRAGIRFPGVGSATPLRFGRNDGHWLTG